MRVSSVCCPATSLSCWSWSCLTCSSSPWSWSLGGGLPLEGLAGEVLPVRGECLPCLRLELDDVLLELLRLELEALLRGDDVGDAALDVLELRLHLLV